MLKQVRMAMAAVVVAAAFTSCASYQKQAAVMGIGRDNINTYVEADLDYNNAKRIEGIVQSKHILGIPVIRNGNKLLSNSNRYRGLSKVEQQALYRAKETAGVDIVLDPEFETEKHCWFFGLYRTKQVKVKGWGVNIKGIREDKHGNPNQRGEFNAGGFLGF